VFQPSPHPYLVPIDGSFRLTSASTRPPKGAPDRDGCRKRRGKLLRELQSLQRVFYAHDRYALLLVFQAMDAAGKDSTIRTVMSGVNPAGCQVFNFKKPAPIELDHDFLWRSSQRLPERGRFGIFNRSHYEEVLVVKVHPELLTFQQLPGDADPATFWSLRYESIRDHEKHLARNGTVILKFWLNVSRDEQRKRFLSRLEEPKKHWKFNIGDVEERSHWAEYMLAYEDALRETSRPWAPWYAIPADDKPYLRLQVTDIIVQTLRALPLAYPEPSGEDEKRFDEMREQLEKDA
jgi:PPK2 family polyphosphate:nucleotide phosphotransferase